MRGHVAQAAAGPAQGVGSTDGPNGPGLAGFGV